MHISSLEMLVSLPSSLKSAYPVIPATSNPRYTNPLFEYLCIILAVLSRIVPLSLTAVTQASNTDVPIPKPRYSGCVKYRPMRNVSSGSRINKIKPEMIQMMQKSYLRKHLPPTYSRIRTKLLNVKKWNVSPLAPHSQRIPFDRQTDRQTHTHTCAPK